MGNLTLRLSDTGNLSVAPFRTPPPPIIKNSVYLQCTSDGASVSALSMTVPSLSERNANKLAVVLRKAADLLESKDVVLQAGTKGDKGVKIDLMAVMANK